MGMIQRLLLVMVVLVALSALSLWLVFGGAKRQEDGEITQVALKQAAVAARDARQDAAMANAPTRILFGDLHVHTTWSVDAFMWSLPLMGGEGAHPPADACDFARYCSQLDFYALTDHAEALNPRTWADEKESVRQCNAVHEASGSPDVIAFTGFEWSNVGITLDEHYGHKNVIFKHTDEARLPARPIGTPGVASRAFSDRRNVIAMLGIPVRAFPNQQPYLDIARHINENASYPFCEDDIDTTKLPRNCRERAGTPAVLFKKLREWGFETLVIPHGMTWGFYTPRAYVWDKQLKAELDDAELQNLVEVFSGHGNSEEYREFRAAIVDEDGTSSCPEPTDDYEPCCWRAGEIIRRRCSKPNSAKCQARVQKARADYLRAGVAGHVAIPGATVKDWANCGQCNDCFNPAYQYRPGGAAQYMLARGNFDAPESPRHHTMGFIASSDNHSARPGTGYKEFARLKMTEARGARTETWRAAVFGERGPKLEESITYTIDDLMTKPPQTLMWMERQASFFVTGGFVAVHATERSRDAIWKAMQDRNVYGTSGDRILLWFDLLNGPDGELPMGSATAIDEAPRFRVRTAGEFEQLPGCPEDVAAALGADRIESVCAGECYNPTSKRRKMTRVEVIRIRRQMSDDEPVRELIEDPWKVLPCEGEGDVCTVEFDDPEFTTSDREVLYYVRALQEPTLAVNAGQLRCEGEVCKPCFGNYQTPGDDDCLVPNEERAWSSPIYVRRAEAAATEEEAGGASDVAP